MVRTENYRTNYYFFTRGSERLHQGRQNTCQSLLVVGGAYTIQGNVSHGTTPAHKRSLATDMRRRCHGAVKKSKLGYGLLCNRTYYCTITELVTVHWNFNQSDFALSGVEGGGAEGKKFPHFYADF